MTEGDGHVWIESACAMAVEQRRPHAWKQHQQSYASRRAHSSAPVHVLEGDSRARLWKAGHAWKVDHMQREGHG